VGHNGVMPRYDAVVVGSGPNGLAAAVELTTAGRRVLVVEGADVIGGGTRTEELTLPGFLHDVCSAIHPLGVASPFLASHGIGDWIHPDVPATHPLGDGRVVVLHESVDDTVSGLGTDGARYRRLIGGLVDRSDDVIDAILNPLPMVPDHPLTLARFGIPGLIPASTLVRTLRTEEGRALFAGLASHAIAPFSRPMTGAVVQAFAVSAHASGWPLVRGGSQRLAEAMADIVTSAGGVIETGRWIRSLAEFEEVPVVMLDVMPPAAVRIGGTRIHRSAAKRMAKWSSGPGVFKVDWALDGPIPWSDEWSRRSGTVHVGGTYEEIAASERAVHDGQHPEDPFVIVAQQSLFDDTRAPVGKHTGWGYCHVPSGSGVDMTEAIEAQIERFAPGFRDRILARHTMGPRQYEEHNPNYVAGDIAGGAFSLGRTLRFGYGQYRIGDGLYLCSSATSPGAGVHGMCGYHAARAALLDTR